MISDSVNHFSHLTLLRASRNIFLSEAQKIEAYAIYVLIASLVSYHQFLSSLYSQSQDRTLSISLSSNFNNASTILFLFRVVFHSTNSTHSFFATLFISIVLDKYSYINLSSIDFLAHWNISSQDFDHVSYSSVNFLHKFQFIELSMLSNFFNNITLALLDGHIILENLSSNHTFAAWLEDQDNTDSITTLVISSSNNHLWWSQSTHDGNLLILDEISDNNNLVLSSNTNADVNISLSIQLILFTWDKGIYYIFYIIKHSTFFYFFNIFISYSQCIFIVIYCFFELSIL